MRPALALFLLALPLALCAEEPPFRSLRADPSGVRGEADLPDRTVVTLTLRAFRPSAAGPQERLVEVLQAPVKDGAFEAPFEPGRIAHGAYRLEISVDRARQLPYLRLPDGELRAEAAFVVDFTEDIAGPAEALAAGWAALRGLETERQKALALPENGYAGFLPGWEGRVRLEARRLAVYEEDLLYPEARRLLGALASKLLVLGHDRVNETVEADFAKAADALAGEFAFHAATKAREALERAEALAAAGKEAAWARYRESFLADQARIRAGLARLSEGPLKEAMARKASRVPAILDAGERLASAGDAAALRKLLAP